MENDLQILESQVRSLSTCLVEAGIQCDDQAYRTLKRRYLDGLDDLANRHLGFLQGQSVELGTMDGLCRELEQANQRLNQLMEEVGRGRPDLERRLRSALRSVDHAHDKAREASALGARAEDLVEQANRAGRQGG
jgi:hypothetical protein